jgi:hypothetical protein
VATGQGAPAGPAWGAWRRLGRGGRRGTRVQPTDIQVQALADLAEVLRLAED